MYKLWCIYFLFLSIFIVFDISSKELKAMTFNVQNLFDGNKDGTEYQEYSPPRWNNTQYQRRLSAVGKALQKLSFSLDIIVLQEVENKKVVQDIQKYYLPNLVYVAVSTAKKSAVQIALLSRYKIISVNEHQVQIPSLFGLRSILEVLLRFPSKKNKKGITAAIQVFAVHLKSKRKSDINISSEQIRAFQYKLLANNINISIPTLFLGDFNDEDAYAHLQDAYYQKHKQNIESLIHTSKYYDIENTINGTYYYKGWMQLDHIFFDSSFETVFSKLAISIIDDTPFTIVSKKSNSIITNKFNERIGNYSAVSDHLPVLLIAHYK